MSIAFCWQFRSATKAVLPICNSCIHKFYATQALKAHVETAVVPKKLPQIQEIIPDFPNVIQNASSSEIGFWQSERGLKVKDTLLTATGRLLRLFVSIERYNNYWESCVVQNARAVEKFNMYDEYVNTRHGAEWAACLLVLQLGGAVKLVTDDRWVDDADHFRTPKKKDCTIDAIDLRNSCVSYNGLRFLHRLGYVRYLNVADCPHFTNECMTRLHPLADTLEYLDVSGTQISPESFSYLRVFPRLRWLNLSRLQNPDKLTALLPYLYEILPPECVVVLNDNIAAERYGTLIPYRSSRDSNRDQSLDKNPGIGDPVVFNQIYGENALKVQDVSHVHQMWKTPKQSERRRTQLTAMNTHSKIAMKTLVEYIKKAEKYPPLL
uniref:Uncharacterized protein n=1 Tax=Ciona savignyi TaxID=51511 RepID=H2Z6Z2_CIOSA